MDLYFSTLLFILGAMFGSFLGCMGYRIPNKIKTTYPSSFCPECKKQLKWYMNIPIISYIVLKGKCAYCNKKIGFIYFLCEILCACLFVLSYILFKFDINFFLSIVLICDLVTTIVSDFKYYYISDRVIIISYICILIILYIFEKDIIISRVITSVILFLIMIGIKILGNNMFNKESLGDGDIKLMAVIACSIGLINSFISLFISSLLALIYSIITIRKNKEGIIPFGPFLLLGALITLYLYNFIEPYIIEYLF